MALLSTVRVLATPLRAARTTRPYSAAASAWGDLKVAPFDGNHATAQAHDADPSPLKVNLGRGVYKDDNGKSWTLPSVDMAVERILQSNHGHDYLPFSGLKEFCKTTAKFAWGDAEALKDGRIATIQTISGTGGLRVGSKFIRHAVGDQVSGTVLLPEPTYVNHFPIFELEDFKIGRYRYYDLKNNCLDMSGLLEDLNNAPQRSVALLHACAHNPTGMDPTHEQWKEISEVCLKKNHLVFFDSAYQGFASGNPELDAFAYRYFVDEGHEVLMAQSYAKNMGLYGQRIGALHITSKDSDNVPAIMSQLNKVVRPLYSNPHQHGARIVHTVLSTPEIRAQWEKDVQTMADRITGMRTLLVKTLGEIGSKRDWSHISKQIGMFAYSGLSADEVTALRGKHVYLNLDGRMSMSGVNSKNVTYLAECMHAVTN